jgi:hypothetical protein
MKWYPSNTEKNLWLLGRVSKKKKTIWGQGRGECWLRIKTSPLIGFKLWIWEDNKDCPDNRWGFGTISDTLNPWNYFIHPCKTDGVLFKFKLIRGNMTCPLILPIIRKAHPLFLLSPPSYVLSLGGWWLHSIPDTLDLIILLYYLNLTYQPIDLMLARYTKSK